MSSVVFLISIIFPFQLIMGFSLSRHGIPRMRFSFLQSMRWNRTLWTIPPILKNRVVVNFIFPPSFGERSMFHMRIGSLSR